MRDGNREAVTVPVVDASAYCELCGHQHRPGSRCKIRDSSGERCDCTGGRGDHPEREGR